MRAALVALAAGVLVACSTGSQPPPPPPPLGSPIVFGQVFTGNSTAATIPYAKFIWSDNGHLAIPGVPAGQYTMAYRLASVSLAWLQANHPDWLILVNGAPVYQFGDTRYPVVDITNPAVVAFKQAEILAAHRTEAWLSIDNVDTHQTPGQVDPDWTAHNLAYIKAMATWGHGNGYKVMVNDTAGSTAVIPADEEAVALAVDGVLVEGFPQDACYTDASYTNGEPRGAQFDRMYGELVAEGAKEPTFLASYSCADAPTGTEITWTLAVYLLLLPASEPAYVALTSEAKSSYPADYAGLSWALGAPLEPPPPATGSRPYVRHYQGGLVTLDALTGAATVSIY